MSILESRDKTCHTCHLSFHQRTFVFTRVRTGPFVAGFFLVDVEIHLDSSVLIFDIGVVAREPFSRNALHVTDLSGSCALLAVTEASKDIARVIAEGTDKELFHRNSSGDGVYLTLFFVHCREKTPHFFVYSSTFIRPWLVVVAFVVDAVERIEMKVERHPSIGKRYEGMEPRKRRIIQTSMITRATRLHTMTNISGFDHEPFG
jgi:hypothetical protein